MVWMVIGFIFSGMIEQMRFIHVLTHTMSTYREILDLPIKPRKNPLDPPTRWQDEYFCCRNCQEYVPKCATASHRNGCKEIEGVGSDAADSRWR